MRQRCQSLFCGLTQPHGSRNQHSSLCPERGILHPNGFGSHSYAACKAQTGLPDTSGSKYQALYFQKMKSTTTFAAGVAVLQGIEGTPTSALTGLEFWIPTNDGSHCGAGAPRYNVRVKTTAGPS